MSDSFATSWIIVGQAPLSHEIFQARILEWVVISSPGDLPEPGTEPASPALQADSLHLSHPGSALRIRQMLVESVFWEFCPVVFCFLVSFVCFPMLPISLWNKI